MTAIPHRYCQSCGRRVLGYQCRCKSTRLGAKPPAYSHVHCRTCAGKSRWEQVLFERSGGSPPVVHWRCLGCGSTRYQYADCTNVASLCATIMEANLRATGANLDHDEALDRLVLQAWRLYLGWNPVQDPNREPMNFEGYAHGILTRRANDIYRQMLGRNGEKPLANAVSLNGIQRDWGELVAGTGADPSDASLTSVRMALQ